MWKKPCHLLRSGYHNTRFHGKTVVGRPRNIWHAPAFLPTCLPSLPCWLLCEMYIALGSSQAPSSSCVTIPFTELLLSCRALSRSILQQCSSAIYFAVSTTNMVHLDLLHCLCAHKALLLTYLPTYLPQFSLLSLLLLLLLCFMYTDGQYDVVPRFPSPVEFQDEIQLSSVVPLSLEAKFFGSCGSSTAQLVDSPESTDLNGVSGVAKCNPDDDDQEQTDSAPRRCFSPVKGRKLAMWMAGLNWGLRGKVCYVFQMPSSGFLSVVGSA